VPQAALQLDQGGAYVLVVNSQDQVEQRRVQTGQAYGGNLVVQSGLQAGESVIVEGIQKVRPGMKVQANVVPLATSAADISPSAASESADTSGESSAHGAPAPAAGASAAPAPPSNQ
jgi:membrane fusion protein, multidrug efflux system